ncbi:MAG: sigma-70 family RNA polymerase sigma factor [Kiritimatiellae bacterium]|nr:sigma-70 family RNA polymerase sigma factor [Kiritimatiellia bacterium]
MPNDYFENEDLMMKRAMELQPVLMAYVTGMVGNLDVAEDVVQNGLIRIWSKREVFTPGKSFRSWCFEICRRTALEWIRAQKRAPIALDEETISALADDHAACEQAAPELFSLEALRRCLAKLSDRTRELLDLKYAGNLDCGQIAARFGRPVESVYVTLSRTRAQLRDCILKQRAMEPLQ